MNLIILGITCIFNKILKKYFFWRNFNVLSPNLFREGTHISFIYNLEVTTYEKYSHNMQHTFHEFQSNIYIRIMYCIKFN